MQESTRLLHMLLKGYLCARQGYTFEAFMESTGATAEELNVILKADKKTIEELERIEMVTDLRSLVRK